MPGSRLLLQTQEVLDEARELLDHLPPLSPDHENVRLAVVKLRRTQATLKAQPDLASKALVHSHETVDKARVVIDKVRNSATERGRRRGDAIHHLDDGGGPATDSSRPASPLTVFLDMDTVLLAKHPGRYGPELGVQVDLSDAVARLFEVSDRVVVLVNPPSPESGHNFDTAHRVAALQADLNGDWDGLVLATCEHGEDGTCDCAKPGHGLITPHLDSGRRAEDGWYVGGDQEGMVAGRSAGLHTVRIGPHGEDHLSVVHRPDYEARDLMDAANHIMVQALTAP